MVEFHRQPPYIIIFRDARREFVYIGSEHSHDPKHPQFGVIERYWDKWLSGKQPDSCIALIEGGDISEPLDSGQAVPSEGERGYLWCLAKDAGVDCLSPEPGYKDEMQELLKTYSKEQVVHYYFIRAVVQWHRLDPRPEPGDYFSFIKEVPKRYGLAGFKLDINKLEDIHQQVTGRQLDIEDVEFLKSLVDPYQTVAITNQVSVASMKFRDDYIVRQINGYWQKGKNIFSVIGHSHVEEQEEYLKQLLN